MKSKKKYVVWLLTVMLAMQNILPAMAEGPGYQTESAAPKQKMGNSDRATPSDADEQEDEKEEDIATPSDADKEKDIFLDMPEIGSREFTSWFFKNKDSEELWDWVMALLDAKLGEDYDVFYSWYSNHEEDILKAYHQFLGIDLLESATGDLWNNWNGDMDFPGDGTEAVPYQINTLSQLMGLSEAVASGTSFQGAYLELTQDLDLSGIVVNGGNWNPIGWYQNASELSGAVSHPFKGYFDGGGNTISGLKVINIALELQNVGLFGSVEGGSIKNLTVEADTVKGFDNIAVLAGSVSGNTVIYDVTVSGYVSSKGDAGGIAGEVTGGADYITIENSTAENIVLNSENSRGYVGGIAGNVQKADLIDNMVMTQDGDSDRIQGKGYVGGIAGRMNLTNIYNSYVSGTIGGNGSLAVGGVVGKYESGNLILARFAGEVSRTNGGTAAHEGTFVGTRESGHKFTYGIQKNNNLSYLFTTDANKAKKVFGSNIDNDNIFTSTAHIGYWTENESKFVIIAGSTQTVPDIYFYEELEAGVKYIVTLKLDNDFTSDGYGKGLAFKIDHFAPGSQGRPIRGYLISVPRIDARNAGGTYDVDVATLTAMPTGNNSYYRQIDKDNPSAVAPGLTVAVSTAPKNSDGNRYQMVYDEAEAGKVKPPTYTDEMGGQDPMAYMSGGTYNFEMPEHDTEINVEYIKVTTKLTMEPEETTISVTHTRNGDRKLPSVTTEVKNAEGILIARYINGAQDDTVAVYPVTVHAEHNNTGSSADRSVLWSVDDTNLLVNSSEVGYTLTDARVMPNLQSTFIQNIISKEIKAQADGGYANKINNTIYTKSAVVTASTNPATSSDNQAVYGNTRINVTFQIVDNTTVRVEGLVLNKSEVTYTVTRKLTGNRLHPEDTITCSAPVILTATLNPVQPFYKNVSWSDRENGKVITLTSKGTNTQDCEINIQYDPNGTDNPAWIQNIINEDNTKKAADKGYLKLSGSATQSETVTAVSEDQTHGNVTAVCNVTINFITVDETVIHPENVILNQYATSYDLIYNKAGDIQSETVSMDGFHPTNLTATVNPDILVSDGHKPYNREVIWNSEDDSALTVDKNGTIQPVKDASWIREAMKKAPYEAVRTVKVTATATDNGQKADCVVTLRFKASCIEMDKESLSFDLVLTKTGRRLDPNLVWSGQEAQKVTAVVYGKDDKTPVYTSEDSEKLTISSEGIVTPNLSASWIQETITKYPFKASAEVMLSACNQNSSMKDNCTVKLNVKVVDDTYSGGGSSSGGGGGGGGGGSTGVTPAGSKKASAAPAGAVIGTWIQTADQKWIFTSSGRTYNNEWAYIHNPYATLGQEAADWFRFSESGHMITGWFIDSDGNTYYLNPVSDNTLGRMLTGWQWISGSDGKSRCYYFKEASDGTRGAMIRGTTAPDGSQVDENGAWTANRIVQER